MEKIEKEKRSNFFDKLKNKISKVFLLGFLTTSFSCEDAINEQTGTWDPDFIKKEADYQNNNLIKIKEESFLNFVKNFENYLNFKKRKDKTGIIIEKDNQIFNFIIEKDNEKGQLKIIFLSKEGSSDSRNKEESPIKGKYGFVVFYSDGTLMLWADFDTKQELEDFNKKKYFLVGDYSSKKDNSLEDYSGVVYYYNRALYANPDAINYNPKEINETKQKADYVIELLKNEM